MAFRKGKNKNLKQRLPIFGPFTYFRRRRAITAEELLQLLSHRLHLHLQVCSALSSSSSLHFISLQPLHLSPLHLIGLRPRSTHPTAPRTPPPPPPTPPPPSSPSLHLSLPSSHPTMPCSVFFFVFFILS